MLLIGDGHLMLKTFQIQKNIQFLLLFLVFALFSFSFAKNDYFPNQEGLTWTYSNGEEQRMSGPYNLEDTAVMVLTHYMNGEIASEEYLVYAENGVFNLGTASDGGELLRYDPPLVVYEGSSLTVGQSWQSKSVIKGIEINFSSEVIGVQGIKTESGRYNALIIRQQTFTDTGGQTALDVYFVPGIGIVRFSSSDGDVIDLVEKSF